MVASRRPLFGVSHQHRAPDPLDRLGRDRDDRAFARHPRLLDLFDDVAARLAPFDRATEHALQHPEHHPDHADRDAIVFEFGDVFGEHERGDLAHRLVRDRPGEDVLVPGRPVLAARDLRERSLGVQPPEFGHELRERLLSDVQLVQRVASGHQPQLGLEVDRVAWLVERFLAAHPGRVQVADAEAVVGTPRSRYSRISTPGIGFGRFVTGAGPIPGRRCGARV